MHPAATSALTHPVSSVESPASSQPTVQHGSNSFVLADSGSPSSGGASDAQPRSWVLPGGNSASPRTVDKGIPNPVPATPSNTPSDTPSKGIKIAQYESSTSLRSSREAGFIVTKTDWSGRAPIDSPVARFPNEVLVHMLSFLEPPALLNASLVSKRFYTLVSSPHTWRSAFVRNFPPPRTQSGDHGSPLASRDKRYFTRLAVPEIGENDWRREYILRMRLLRSFSKGKVHLPGSSGKSSSGGLIVSYAARVGMNSVTHMATSFRSDEVRCVHASLESQIVSASNPETGKIEKRPPPLFSQEPDLQHLGVGNPRHLVGIDMNANRVMDLSEELGFIMGENIPDGKCYVNPYASPYPAGSNIVLQVIRPAEDGRYGHKPSITALWIAKKRHGGVLENTDQQAAIILGNSRGWVRVFSILFSKSANSVVPVKDFLLCPGVPIVQIRVDEDYSPSRRKQSKPWIMIINALGEIYYLRRCIPGEAALEDWCMVPASARVPTFTYEKVFHAPKGSEENKTPTLLKMDYAKIKELWEGCRMDWFIEVDWAGGNVVVGRTGVEQFWDGLEVEQADIPLRRFHLRNTAQKRTNSLSSLARQTEELSVPVPGAPRSDEVTPPADAGNRCEGRLTFQDEWVVSELVITDGTFTRITAYALDNSSLARITSDDLLQQSIPGGGARWFAVGTNTGSIYVFNIRLAIAVKPVLEAIRTIHTDSPQISTLAISSLAVIHGGDDGLVQAWDPLGSVDAPIRTLHSKFSARARRRIEQNTGAFIDNQFAARCLVLDPDANNLRGTVALGSFVRYWSFAATPGNRRKKRKKASGRALLFSPSRTKEAIREVIQTEEALLKKEMERKRKHGQELEKRYGIGTGMTALNEEEMLAYARMISQETYELESSGRSEITSSTDKGSQTVSPEGSVEGGSDPMQPTRPATDPELELALRLSLQEVAVSDAADQEGKMWEDASSLDSAPGPIRPQQQLDWSRSVSPPKWASPATHSPRGKWAKLPLDSMDEWPTVAGNIKGKGKRQFSNNHTDLGQQAFEDDLELAIRLSLQEK